MPSHGFKSTKKLDSTLREEVLDNALPSVVWYKIVEANQTYTTELDMLSILPDAQVFSIPLDYRHPSGGTRSTNAGSGGSNTSVDYSRYYAAAQPHAATLYPSDKRIVITPSNPTIDELIASGKGLTLYNSDGWRVEVSSIMACSNFSQLQNLGVIKGKGLDSWLLIWITKKIMRGDGGKAKKLFDFLLPDKIFGPYDWIVTEFAGDIYSYVSVTYYNPYYNRAAFFAVGGPENVMYLIGALYDDNHPGTYKTGNRPNPIGQSSFFTRDTSVDNLFTTPKSSLYIHPDARNARSRSLVFIVANVTTEHIKQLYGENSMGYGFTDGTRTINQKYSNFFVHEEVHTRALQTPRSSLIGAPRNGGSQYFYWDKGAGGTSNRVVYDVLSVPLESYIQRHKPAFVVLHNTTNTEFAFVGFSSNSQRYTHANFMVPAYCAGSRIDFSVMSTAPQNGVRYASFNSTFYSRHVYKDAACSDRRGSVWCGGYGTSTVRVKRYGMRLVADPDAYGVMVKATSGEVVYNSTAYIGKNPGLHRLDNFSIGAKTGTLSGRSTSRINVDVPNASENLYTRAVFGGTFNALDFSFFDTQWDYKHENSWFDYTTYNSYVQDILGSTTVSRFVGISGGYRLSTTMAPIWNWSVKVGHKSGGLTFLGSVFGFALAAVATYFGFYSVAASLVSMQASLNASFAGQSGMPAMSSSFLFKEGKANIYTLDVPLLVTHEP